MSIADSLSGLDEMLAESRASTDRVRAASASLADTTRDIHQLKVAVDARKAVVETSLAMVADAMESVGRDLDHASRAIDLVWETGDGEGPDAPAARLSIAMLIKVG
jgi:hypothetical protein